MSRRHLSTEAIGVAEAKRRFSELLDRVSAGERIVVERRGRPTGVLVPASPEALETAGAPPGGLASVAGALGDWPELETVVEELYAARAEAADRPVSNFE